MNTNNQRRIRGLTSLIGNTGISFSAIGRALGHPVSIFMPDWMSEEPQKNGYLTPHIKLREVTAFKRVCYTCCDPQECMEAATIDITTDGALPHCPRRL